MTKIFYKATRPDGTDFRTGTVDYAGALATGEPVTHPTVLVPVRDNPSTYLSVSVEPAETLLGGSWPCRLFRVEPIGEVLGSDMRQHKRACSGLYVREELPAHMALGPQGEAVTAFLDGVPAARDAAWDAAWNAAWDAAWNAAWNAARDAAWNAARNAAWNAARDAARNAAWDAAWRRSWDAAWAAAWAAGATLVRDLITKQQYETLVRPWGLLAGEADA